MKDLLFRKSFNFFTIILSFITGMAMLTVIIEQRISLWPAISFVSFILHLSCETVSEKKVKYCPRCGMNIKDYFKDMQEE